MHIIGDSENFPLKTVNKLRTQSSPSGVNHEERFPEGLFEQSPIRKDPGPSETGFGSTPGRGFITLSPLECLKCSKVPKMPKVNEFSVSFKFDLAEGEHLNFSSL